MEQEQTNSINIDIDINESNNYNNQQQQQQFSQLQQQQQEQLLQNQQQEYLQQQQQQNIDINSINSQQQQQQQQQQFQQQQQQNQNQNISNVSQHTARGNLWNEYIGTDFQKYDNNNNFEQDQQFGFQQQQRIQFNFSHPKLKSKTFTLKNSIYICYFYEHSMIIRKHQHVYQNQQQELETKFFESSGSSNYNNSNNFDNNNNINNSNNSDFQKFQGQQQEFWESLQSEIFSYPNQNYQVQYDFPKEEEHQIFENNVNFLLLKDEKLYLTLMFSDGRFVVYHLQDKKPRESEQLYSKTFQLSTKYPIHSCKITAYNKYTYYLITSQIHAPFENILSQQSQQQQQLSQNSNINTVSGGGIERSILFFYLFDSELIYKQSQQQQLSQRIQQNLIKLEYTSDPLTHMNYYLFQQQSQNSKQQYQQQQQQSSSFLQKLKNWNFNSKLTSQQNEQQALQLSEEVQQESGQILIIKIHIISSQLIAIFTTQEKDKQQAIFLTFWSTTKRTIVGDQYKLFEVPRNLSDFKVNSLIKFRKNYFILATSNGAYLEIQRYSLKFSDTNNTSNNNNNVSKSFEEKILSYPIKSQIMVEDLKQISSIQIQQKDIEQISLSGQFAFLRVQFRIDENNKNSNQIEYTETRIYNLKNGQKMFFQSYENKLVQILEDENNIQCAKKLKNSLDQPDRFYTKFVKELKQLKNNYNCEQLKKNANLQTIKQLDETQLLTLHIPQIKDIHTYNMFQGNQQSLIAVRKHGLGILHDIDIANTQGLNMIIKHISEEIDPETIGQIVNQDHKCVKVYSLIQSNNQTAQKEGFLLKLLILNQKAISNEVKEILNCQKSEIKQKINKIHETVYKQEMPKRCIDKITSILNQLQQDNLLGEIFEMLEAWICNLQGQLISFEPKNIKNNDQYQMFNQTNFGFQSQKLTSYLISLQNQNIRHFIIQTLEFSINVFSILQHISSKFLNQFQNKQFIENNTYALYILYSTLNARNIILSENNDNNNELENDFDSQEEDILNNSNYSINQLQKQRHNLFNDAAFQTIWLPQKHTLLSACVPIITPQQQPLQQQNNMNNNSNQQQQKGILERSMYNGGYIFDQLTFSGIRDIFRGLPQNLDNNINNNNISSIRGNNLPRLPFLLKYLIRKKDLTQIQDIAALFPKNSLIIQFAKILYHIFNINTALIQNQQAMELEDQDQNNLREQAEQQVANEFIEEIHYLSDDISEDSNNQKYYIEYGPQIQFIKISNDNNSKDKFGIVSQIMKMQYQDNIDIQQIHLDIEKLQKKHSIDFFTNNMKNLDLKQKLVIFFMLNFDYQKLGQEIEVDQFQMDIIEMSCKKLLCNYALNNFQDKIEDSIKLKLFQIKFKLLDQLIGQGEDDIAQKQNNSKITEQKVDLLQKMFILGYDIEEIKNLCQEILIQMNNQEISIKTIFQLIKQAQFLQLFLEQFEILMEIEFKEFLGYARRGGYKGSKQYIELEQKINSIIYIILTQKITKVSQAERYYQASLYKMKFFFNLYILTNELSNIEMVDCYRFILTSAEKYLLEALEYFKIYQQKSEMKEAKQLLIFSSNPKNCIDEKRRNQLKNLPYHFITYAHYIRNQILGNLEQFEQQQQKEENDNAGILVEQENNNNNDKQNESFDIDENSSVFKILREMSKQNFTPQTGQYFETNIAELEKWRLHLKYTVLLNKKNNGQGVNIFITDYRDMIKNLLQNFQIKQTLQYIKNTTQDFRNLTNNLASSYFEASQFISELQQELQEFQNNDKEEQQKEIKQSLNIQTSIQKTQAQSEEIKEYLQQILILANKDQQKQECFQIIIEVFIQRSSKKRDNTQLANFITIFAPEIENQIPLKQKLLDTLYFYSQSANYSYLQNVYSLVLKNVIEDRIIERNKFQPEQYKSGVIIDEQYFRIILSNKDNLIPDENIKDIKELIGELGISGNFQ